MKKSEYIEIGDIVKVKEGVMCPDFKDLNIAGWQGTVIDIDKDDKNNILIGISWDSTTLEDMPENFIENGEENGLDNDLMYLFYEEVEVVKKKENIIE